MVCLFSSRSRLFFSNRSSRVDSVTSNEDTRLLLVSLVWENATATESGDSGESLLF